MSYKIKSKVVSLLLLAMGTSWISFGDEGFEPNDFLPDLGQFDLVGEVPEIQGKVTLVDFWASWCVPCKASFPSMEAIYRKFRDRGFQIIAVSVDSNSASMDKFLNRLQPSFSTLHDVSQKLVSYAGIEVMPTSFLVDKRGVVRFTHLGWAGKSSEQKLEGEVEALLEEADQ